MNKIRKSLIAILVTGLLTMSACDTKKPANQTSSSADDDTKASLVANDVYIEPTSPTNAQIKAYNELSSAIENKNSKEEAKQVAVSFAFDFFTLSNKKDQSDMGGLQFIPTSYINQFKEFATAYYYGNYPTIVNEYNKKSLPEVTSVEVTDQVEGQNLTYLDQPVDGYVLTLKVSYANTKVKSLKTSMNVTVIHMNDYDYDAEIKQNEYTGETKPVYRVMAVE